MCGRRKDFGDTCLPASAIEYFLVFIRKPFTWSRVSNIWLDAFEFASSCIMVANCFTFSCLLLIKSKEKTCYFIVFTAWSQSYLFTRFSLFVDSMTFITRKCSHIHATHTPFGIWNRETVVDVFPSEDCVRESRTSIHIAAVSDPGTYEHPP